MIAAFSENNMEKTKFIEELGRELVRRGIDQDTVNSELVPVTSFFEENGIEDVEVTVDEMANEIVQMLSDDDGGNSGSVGNEDTEEKSVSVEDEIEQAIRSVESGSSAAEAEPVPDITVLPVIPAQDPAEENVRETENTAEDAAGESAPVPEDAADGNAGAVPAEDAAGWPESHEERVPASKRFALIRRKKNEKHRTGAVAKDEAARGNTDIFSAQDDFSDYEKGSDALTGEEPGEMTDDDMKIAGAPVSEEDEPESDDMDYFEGDVDVEEFRPLSKAEKKKRNKKKKILSADENPQLTEDDGRYFDEEKVDRLVENIRTNRTLFWVVFAITLPIVIVLALACVAIYIGFWIALAILMIGIVTGLIIFVSVGAIISLIGIVYGAIQLIKGLTPVGMFEIGLGVTVGAAVMFIGILVYNIAIRLIPFAMKMLAKLLALGFKKTKDGYVALKGVLDRI